MSVIAERRFARWPGGVNIAVLGVMLVLVTLLGVRVAQTPPPQIAAFAPELQNHSNSSAASGTLAGPGGAEPAGVAAPTPTPTPTPSATPASNPPPKIPAVRPCYGSPPRQTPDPQSPPCVPYFDPNASNGGATSPGVTKDSIYVAWPDLGNPLDGFYDIEREQDTRDFATYVNNHFEFYGRKLVLVPFRVYKAGFNTNSAAQMQQDATTAANLEPGIGVFASIEYAPVGGTAFYYYNQLAQDRIVSIDSDVMAQDYNESFGPYEWSTVPSTEGFMSNLGALVCNQLRGQPPQFAGQPPGGTTSWGKRSFRIVVGAASNGLTWAYQPLAAALSGCGLDGSTIDHVSSSTDSSEAANLATHKCASGLGSCPISTVLCICSGADLAGLMNAAQQQGYFPEWTVSGQGAENQDSQSSSSGSGAGTTGYPASQLSHIIGITYDNKIDPPANEFWYSALKEVDPNYQYGDNALDYWDYFRYEQLMVLASGLQAAGPDLTPTTFANGLYGLHFPDPGAGAAPYYQARVGFSPSNHHWFLDAAAIWYDVQASNYTTSEPRTGSFCYSRGGQRSATWTDVSPLFYNNQSCR
ncbi:MAG: ABC transporter substrate-binding protein [Candidatus Dormibacteria bacterium]